MDFVLILGSFWEALGLDFSTFWHPICKRIWRPILEGNFEARNTKIYKMKV